LFGGIHGNTVMNAVVLRIMLWIRGVIFTLLVPVVIGGVFRR